MKSLTILVVVFIGITLALPAPDGRFLHNHCSDPGSDCRRLLASTLASQCYRIPPPAMFIQDVRGSQVLVEYGVGEGLLMSIMIGHV